MTRSPLDRLRDRMLDAPAEVEDRHLPPRFNEARRALAEALAAMEAAGMPNETLVTVMLAEMLPRMVHQNGPEWAAAMLAKLARNIGAGASPAGTRQ
jgi:hypothetical protein